MAILRKVSSLSKLPTFGLLLLPPFCTDFADEEDVRGWLPGTGDIALTGTVGGGPGSAAGDLL